MKSIFYIGFILAFASCVVVKPESRHEPKTASEYYFPSISEDYEKAQSESIVKKDFSFRVPEPNDSLGEYRNNWYSKHLKSLKEPILYNQRGKGLKIIRFTHLGTWSHPYSYRIENYNDSIIGTYSRTKGQGGYETGRRDKYEQKELSIEKWNQIIAKVDSVGFWNIQTHDPNLVLDGSEWILEIVWEDDYHFVTRNSPDAFDGKDYAELCEFIKDSF